MNVSIVVAFGIFLMGTQALFTVVWQMRKTGIIQSRAPLAFLMASILLWWIGAKQLSGNAGNLVLLMSLFLMLSSVISADRIKKTHLGN